MSITDSFKISMKMIKLENYLTVSFETKNVFAVRPKNFTLGHLSRGLKIYSCKNLHMNLYQVYL
jgi:hypothetical protein